MLEIPDLLVDYRFVKKKPIEPSNCPRQELGVRWLRELYRDDPRGFLKEWTKLESAYLQAVEKYQEPTTAPSEWDGKGSCPTCKREPEAPVEDLSRWKLDEMSQEIIARLKGTAHAQ